MSDRLLINRLKIPAIIGIHPPERSKKQDLFLTIEMELDLDSVCENDNIESTADYGKIADLVIAYVEVSRRYTIETLAQDIARICFDETGDEIGLDRVTVLIEKPEAHHRAESMAVQISRTESDLSIESVVVGLGSNHHGESMLPLAVVELKALGKVARTSRAYRSEDTSGRSQGPYVNAAVMLTTLLPPLEVRRRLKEIESSLGRMSSAKKVPIDLDICLFGAQVINEEPLRVPPAELSQNGYLATTVAELDPHLKHPQSGETIRAIAERLCDSAALVEDEGTSKKLLLAVAGRGDVVEPTEC